VRTGGEEHAGARFERRAGRHDVIDQHERAAAHACSRVGQTGQQRGTPERERTSHVALTLRRRQSGLRPAQLTPAKHSPHGQTKMARQIVGLVEPSSRRAPGVQGDGHERIGAAQHFRS
jgi:hypothetical protein